MKQDVVILAVRFGDDGDSVLLPRVLLQNMSAPIFGALKLNQLNCFARKKSRGGMIVI